MSKDEISFIDEIERFRAYADRPSSESDEENASLTESPMASPSMESVHGATKSNIIENAEGEHMATQTSYVDETTREFKTLVAETLTMSDIENVTEINLSSGRQRPHNKETFEHDLPDLPEVLSGDMPCHILFLDGKTSKLQTFKSFDQLSEHLINVESNEEKYEYMFQKIMAFPLKKMTHYISMSEYLRHLYENDYLTDIQIDVKGQRFTAHRIALCCHSDYFSELFKTIKSNKIPFELQIKGISAESFASFLEFCYTGEISVDSCIAADLLIVADVLRVRALKNQCKSLTKNLPLSEAVKILVGYKGNTFKNLYGNVVSRILCQFNAAAKEEEFLEMDIDTLCLLLSSDDLLVTTESDVFHTAIRWIVHNIEERVKYTVRLMNLVRFSYMSHSELFSCVETTSLIQGYDKFRDIVLIANWLITAREIDKVDPFRFPVIGPRHCYGSKFAQNSTCVKTTHIQQTTCNMPLTTTHLQQTEDNFPRSIAPVQIVTCRSPATPIQEQPTTPVISPPLMTSTPKRQTMSPTFTKPTMLLQEFQTMVKSMPQTSTPKRQTMSPTFTKPVMLPQEFQTMVKSMPQTSTPKRQTMSPTFTKPVMLPKEFQTMVKSMPQTSTPKRQTMSPTFTKPVMLPKEFQTMVKSIPQTSTPKRPKSPTYSKPMMLPIEMQTKPNSTPQTSILKRPVMSPTFAKPIMVPTDLQTMTKSTPQTVEILVVGGFITDKMSDNPELVQRYDSKHNEWVRFCALPEPRRHHAVATLFGKLYLIAGSDPTCSYGKLPIPTRSVFRMDLSTKKWSRIADIKNDRMNHCACAVNGKIYAIGGKGNNGIVMNSVECYDPHTESWSFAAPMSTPRFAASAARLGTDNIIVAGGIGETTSVPSSLHVLSTVECFSVTENSWTTLNNLRYPRCHSCLVNVGGRLFLCGGATRSYDYKNSVLISVAAIDEYMEKDDVWGNRTEMVIPRHDAGVAVAGNRIYLVGGISSTADRVLQSVECYDTCASTWLSGVQELPFPARWICCAGVVSKWQTTNQNFPKTNNK